MAWNPEDPMEKRKRIAWSVATSCCIETQQDPVEIYERIMNEWDKPETNKNIALRESNKSQAT